MLPLDSPFWSQLSHAYGRAGDIPDLLKQLATLPPHKNVESEPYFSLWSALCHQGDVYTASFAAVPHLVEVWQRHPTRTHWTVIALVSSIEVARLTERGPEVPPELSVGYFSALSAIPGIVAEAASDPWDELRCRVITSAIAAVKGHPRLSDAITELEPATAERLLEEWRFG
jgi:hypothetical protein